MDHETPAPSAKKKSVPAELIVGIILAAAVLLLVFQNTDEVEAQFLFFEWTAQLWLLLLVTAVLGIVAAELITRVIRSRRKRAKSA